MKVKNEGKEEVFKKNKKESGMNYETVNMEILYSYAEKRRKKRWKIKEKRRKEKEEKRKKKQLLNSRK